MADEPQVEEVKDDKSGEGSSESKGANPWIPAAVLMIMAPALMFGIAKFMIMPDLQKTMMQVLDIATSHEKPKETTAEGEVVTEEVYTYKVKNIVANLTGSMQSRYIKVSFTAEGYRPDFVELMTTNEPKIIDATLSILSSLSVVDLEAADARSKIRSDLLTAFASVLKKDIVSQLYFSEFVVQ